MRFRFLVLLLLAVAAVPAHAAVRSADGNGLVLGPGAVQKRGTETRYPLQVSRRDLERAIASGRPLLLPSTGDSPLIARDATLRRRDDGLVVVTARVETAYGPESVVLTIGDGVAFGWLPQKQGPALRIETRDERTWLVEGGTTFAARSPDYLRVPPPTKAQRETRRRQDGTKADGTPNVDVLVLYTPTLVDVWGSDAAMKARVAYLEAITNQAYVDSDVNQTVTIVGAYLVDYVSAEDNHAALDLLTSNTVSPLYKEAHRLRELHGADLVALLREFDRANNTTCGVGWLGGFDGAPFDPAWGFSVSADHGFGEDHCGEWTFAHELGHNMGAHHDMETAGGETGAYPYSRGFRRTLSQTSGFATVMAYNEGPQVRIGRFSNPRQNACLEQACGDAATADNARGLGEAAPSVAAFMSRPASNLPELRIGDAIVTEGDSGNTTVTLTLGLSAPAPGPVTVELQTANGTATMADFPAASGTVQLSTGQLGAQFEIRVRGDTLVERDEYFGVNIVSATGATIADGQAVVTIDNDEAIPTFTLEDVEVEEGDTGTTPLTFTAMLSAPSTNAVTFDVDITEYGVDGAREYDDYTPISWDALTIPAGATSVQFTLDVYGDVYAEPDERLRFVASNLRGAEIGRDWARGWILDDDGGPEGPGLVIENVSVAEGNAGTKTVTIPVALARVHSKAVSFDIEIVGGDASSPGDFTISGGGTIPVGSTSTTITATIAGDTVVEGDEFASIALTNVVNGAAPDAPASLWLLDDDGALPPFVARPDRQSTPGYTTGLDVVRNDVYSLPRLMYGTLTVLGTDRGGSAHVSWFEPERPYEAEISYTPPAGFLGEDIVRYRLCENPASARCVDGEAHVTVGPSDIDLYTSSGRGFTQQGSPYGSAVGARFEGAYASTPLVAPDVDVADIPADPTPHTPWDNGRAGTRTVIRTVPSPPGAARDWKISVEGTSYPRPHLYIGIDTDGGQDADKSELVCVDADAWIPCELDIAHPGTGVVRYWVMMHNPGSEAMASSVLFADVPLIGGDGSLTITGAGRPAVGDMGVMRIAAFDPTILPGEGGRVGYVGARWAPDGELQWQRVRLRQDGSDVPEALALVDGAPRTVGIAGGMAHDRLFIDVPVGASRLMVTTTSAADVDLYLARKALPSGPGIERAPARDAADAWAATPSGNETVIVSSPQPGRWYVTPVVAGDEGAKVTVTADIDGAALPPRSGSYYESSRPGHGLFLYPAGSQWAGLWYTYFDDRTPTWYYLQGAAPDADGLWNGALFRTMWDGDSQTPVQVGTASVTPTGPDAFLFTWSIDGETGSVPMGALGRGCPTLGGAAVDASSHWFNPATSGTGHSVQLWDDYEFYAAFVYDDAGVPRFLTAENSTFAGADATMPIDQLQGFCPTCSWAAPVRTTVGTLRRIVSGGTLQQIGIEATFAGSVSGTWSRLETLQPLGGPGTTQGCAP